MLDLAASLGRHGGPVTCASMCMGSGCAVTGGADGKVLVWDIRRKVRLLTPARSKDFNFLASVGCMMRRRRARVSP